jgi:gallate decarboxylase subunit D
VSKGLEAFTVSESQGNLMISADVVTMGPDLLVTLYGGLMHIGAVAIGQPRPSLHDPGMTSATSSVFTFLGHKEDGIAKSMAEGLAGSLNRKTVVVAGLHWEGLSSGEIATILEICERLKGGIVREAMKG